MKIKIKNKHQMKKRGSQVGIIISFVIFFMFLIFLFVVINQYRQNTDSGNEDITLKQLQQSVIEESTADLTSYSINLNDLPRDIQGNVVNCFGIDNVFGDSKSKIIVKNKNDEVIVGSYGADNNYIYITHGEETFFKIMHSEEFAGTNPITGCQVPFTNYEKGLLKTVPYLFESRLLTSGNSLKVLYENSYSALKQTLQVPSDKDFGFALKEDLGTRIENVPGEKKAYNNPPVGSNVEIFSDDLPVQYVDSQANIKQGWLQVILW